ncbi:hypothetical protein LTR84_005777 [Exophiala bonariae]|uniref:AB hydrolase-1 domain-containing protein n=1 Tax=Exophiala bonariae TaxID=1690606 RepID=A0AAV9N391_9EURO|nr:hypothetical protein LTR84_005777 [Exophiala bonariae]
MSPDLFPGYTSQHVTTSGGIRIFVRTSPVTSPEQSQRPLLLLHGWPQTHSLYHKLAPLLQTRFRLVLMDLRGYGASSADLESHNGSGYSKRIMAQDCISVMEQLGFSGPNLKFDLVGHDRGGRVAYRLALDAPDKINKLVILDITPTSAMWKSFGTSNAGVRAYHWTFLAQKEPFPEALIGSADGGQTFLDATLSTWTASNSLSAFHPLAIQDYREAYCRPETIHATCEDYRAGAFIDNLHDEEDLARGHKITVPVLVLWGNTALYNEAETERNDGPIQVWRNYAVNVRGKPLNSGHFLPEENPEDTAKEMLDFL